MPTCADAPRRGSRLLRWLSRLIPATAAQITLCAAPAWAAHGAHDTTVQASWVITVIRTVTLLAAGIVAGAALLRPLSGPPSRPASVAVSIAAAIATSGSVVAARSLAVVAVLVVLTIVVAVSLARTWRTFGAGVALCAVLAAIMAHGEVVRAVAAVGVAALLGIGTVAATGGLLSRTRRMAPIAVAVVTALGAAGAAVSLAAFSPTRVVPGVPLLQDVTVSRTSLPVLIVPHRPGWNLVHVADRAAVGTDRAHLRDTAPLPGTGGTWALVRLPTGPGRLWIRYGGRVSSMSIDTGRTSAVPDVTGADGPECASSALGGLVAGAEVPLRSCPADRLEDADAEALRGAVDFIAGRRMGSVTLISDSSLRSMAAAQVVRAACRKEHIEVSGRPSVSQPIIIVAGWSAADAALREVANGRIRGAGAYLAPWLLNSSLLSIPAGQLLPLSYSPRDPLPLRYAAELREYFHGEPATAAGFDTWLRTQRSTVSAPMRLYAASLVSWLPRELAQTHDHDDAGWLPQGTVTAVSGPLR